MLVVRGAWGDAYEPAWIRALNELKVSANLFDCHERTLPGFLGRIERRLLIGPSIRRLRRELVQKVRVERPDVVLLYQGHYIDAETIEQIANVSLVVGYHNDDPFGAGKKMLRYRHLHRAFSKYDGFHVYRQVNLAEAEAAGVRRVKVLMPAFVPWVDFPRKPEFNDIDLLFVGHCEPDQRVECLLAARRNGMRIGLYGDPISWKMYAPADFLQTFEPISPLWGDSYRTAISSSHICLCFFSKKNRDQYTRRVFEIMACGGFLLAERTTAMTLMFREGAVCEYFSNKEEMIDKAKFYLSHPEARHRIAQAGLHQVWRDGHDIHSRMRQWLSDISGWQAEKLEDCKVK